MEENSQAGKLKILEDKRREEPRSKVGCWKVHSSYGLTMKSPKIMTELCWKETVSQQLKNSRTQ